LECDIVRNYGFVVSVLIKIALWGRSELWLTRVLPESI
jgi:hypothetical protein